MLQQRNIVLYVILSIVTCGIFGIYWFITITDETNEMVGEQDRTASGVVALLLTIVTCGIYGWYWAYKMGVKVDSIKTMGGTPSSNGGILFVVLQFCGLAIVNYILAQDALNKYCTGGFSMDGATYQQANPYQQPQANPYQQQPYQQPQANPYQQNPTQNNDTFQQ